MGGGGVRILRVEVVLRSYTENDFYTPFAVPRKDPPLGHDKQEGSFLLFCRHRTQGYLPDRSGPLPDFCPTTHSFESLY